MSRPLDGLLVVSLEQAIAAPYCTRLLADQGARVIKVERPDGGDFARAYDTRTRGLASHFVWTNRSKESLALDLKDDGRDRGAAADHRQGRRVRAEPRARRGRAARPRPGANCARATRASSPARSPATAAAGRLRERKAYDLLIQAEAGFLSVTGSDDQMAKAGISIADIAAGVTAYHSILAALIHRGTTGRGRPHRGLDAGGHGRVDGLSRCISPSTARHRRRATAPATRPSIPMAPTTPPTAACFFGLQNDREWAAFAEDVLQRPDLAADPRFKGNAGRADHRDVLEPIITGVLRRALHGRGHRPPRKAPASRTARVSDMAALWDASAAQGARPLGRIRLAGRAAARAEAGQRRRLGAALRSGAGARRTHRQPSSPNSALSDLRDRRTKT